jgi:hypothetical protein
MVNKLKFWLQTEIKLLILKGQANWNLKQSKEGEALAYFFAREFAAELTPANGDAPYYKKNILGADGKRDPYN